MNGPGGMPALGGAWWRPPQTATAAGRTHPTGMHSCSERNASDLYQCLKSSATASTAFN